MGAAVLSFESTLEIHNCCTCGTAFGMSPQLLRHFRQTKDTFYCPNGHGASFTASEADKLRSQLEAKTAEVENERRNVEFERTRRERLERELKIEKKRIEKRLGAGVCLCCRRTFRSLAEHMATKHPELAPSLAVAAQKKRGRKPVTGPPKEPK